MCCMSFYSPNILNVCLCCSTQVGGAGRGMEHMAPKG